MQTRELTIEGVTFNVAPTPIAKLANAWKYLRGPEISTEEGQRALASAVFWGARRAKAEITLEWLEMNIDVHNIGQVLSVFAELNALAAKRVGTEGAAPGEAQSAMTATA